MHSHLRTAIAVMAVLSVMLLPASAGAAVDDYAAQANTTSVRLALFEDVVGGPILELLGTDALASSDPVASAEIFPLRVLGMDTMAINEATSDGEPVRDPAEGDGCLLPIDAQGLTVDGICTTAFADAGGPGEVAANATAELAGVSVDGSFLSGLLTNGLQTTLQDLLDEIADGALADAVEQLRAGCDSLLGEGGDSPLPTGDLFDMLPDQFDDLPGMGDLIVEELAANPCDAIFDLMVVDLVDDATSIDLTPFTDALAEVDLLTITVDGAVSDIAGGDDSVDAEADQALVEITGPPLGDALENAVTALVSSVEDGLLDNLPAEFEDQLPDEADLGGQLGDVLAMIPLLDINDPLITATVSGGTATATLVRDDASTSAGGQAPFVEISLAGLAEALDMDGEMFTQRFEAGQAQELGPLGSLEVGALVTDEDATFEGLPGSTARTSATTLNLLNSGDFAEQAMGGIELVLAESSAGAFGTAPDAPAPPADPADPPLPQTGGGAALFAVLALGGAVLLLRRRD